MLRVGSGLTTMMGQHGSWRDGPDAETEGRLACTDVPQKKGGTTTGMGADQSSGSIIAAWG